MQYYYDLHIHSCLSPCGDADMTPNNIVNMSVIKGLDVIAVADHNCARNAAAVMTCGRRAGLLVIPGMEIECAEEFHLVLLFRDIDGCLAMEKIIQEAMPPIRNKPEIFGEQIVMDEHDEAVGVVDTMLVTACTLTADEVISHVRALGGVCIPAHVDRSSYSIISNLGFIPEEMGFGSVELSKSADRKAVLAQYPYLDRYQLVISSDAHYLFDISERDHALELPELSTDVVIDCLLRKQQG